MSVEEWIEKGYKYFCLQCNTVYKTIPSRWDNSISCMGGEVESCEKCGCDLFMSLKEFIENRSDILDL